MNMACILIVPRLQAMYVVSSVGCISGVSLVGIIRNVEFEDDQKAHQRNHLQILRSAHQDIVNIMTRIHKTFSDDGPEVCYCYFRLTLCDIL